MKHRIVVVGAGYAGACTAETLARRLSPVDTEITVVNAVPDFVQRLRLHRLAAGQEIEAPKLTDVFAGTGIRLRVARVTAVDPERRTVTVADADGGGELGYDTLLYALGSRGADHGVPGAAEHAFDVAARPSALRPRERLDGLARQGEGGRVLVVGDGLTGIETATEITVSASQQHLHRARRREPRPCAASPPPARLARLTETWRRHKPDTTAHRPMVTRPRS
ncbi:NAD(P)/FAD-dependent oxidoreductase [Actinomadura nitritigenes]|uniref:NAD(P)/FAD-dependent oxidoreductase n=1 Tax=Actinomadura nitritigenes TaxID=134602 RepID=UPI0036852724